MNFKTVALSCVCALSLSACAAGNQKPMNNDRINSALEASAMNAKDGEVSPQSLSAMEQLYKRNSDDPDVALRYANTLRKAGYFKRASLVLRPFANDEKLERADILTEHAAIQSALGNYVTAEAAGRKAVLLDPDSGEAYHVLGIALDAQGHHEQARVAFEKALEHWEGDPSPVLNNMGLNLAALGFLEDALEKLRKAMATAPNNTEIERNMRIVSALQYQAVPSRTDKISPPVPLRKPDPNAKASAPKEPEREVVEHTPPVSTNEPELEAVEVEELEALEPDMEDELESIAEDLLEEAEEAQNEAQDITEESKPPSSFND